MERRAFVRRLPVLATGLSSLALTACAGVPYVVPRTGPRGLVVARASIPAEGAAFVQAPGMQRPIFLSLGEGGEFTALLASCTHQGCQPGPVGDRLVCPCHGSEFAFDGTVLEGPASRPLTRYDVVREGDDLVILLEGGRGR